MKLPTYLEGEAGRRLRSDMPAAKLRRILNLLDLDLAEPGPEPDLDDLASRYTIEVPENARQGSVFFSGELSLLGQSKPVHFRYSYAGEFGFYPDHFEGFDVLGSVGQLDVLVWSAGGRTPEWSKIDFGVLNRSMIEALDQLVLEKERPDPKSE